MVDAIEETAYDKSIRELMLQQRSIGALAFKLQLLDAMAAAGYTALVQEFVLKTHYKEQK